MNKKTTLRLTPKDKKVIYRVGNVAVTNTSYYIEQMENYTNYTGEDTINVKGLYSQHQTEVENDNWFQKTWKKVLGKR